jgi:hypothetical protein
MADQKAMEREQHCQQKTMHAYITSYLLQIKEHNISLPLFVDHYRTQLLCRVHEALGKGHNAFAECHTRYTSLGKILAGKEDFAEGFISGTRQRLC